MLPQDFLNDEHRIPVHTFSYFHKQTIPIAKILHLINSLSETQFCITLNMYNASLTTTINIVHGNQVIKQ